MKLYYDPISTTSRAVTLFLADQGICLDEEIVSLHAGKHQTPEFAVINPNMQVPALVDDGLVLTESSAILKYLGEKLGSPAYPTDLRMRARVNEALDWFNTGFHLNFCVFLVYRRLLPDFATLDAAAHKAIDNLGQHRAQKYLDVLNRHMIGGQNFVCGDQITLADYLGATYVTLGEFVGFDLTPWPNVRRWIAGLKARPSWDAAYAGFNGLLSAAHAA
ncbi:glutathione S-transferase family protein [Parvibaculum sedimenti]|uniref:Glutathione S-transferase family protein n=1 Tax=Parvibaculum sedimenti TaxID=2608632 RepID=A0A6N6VGL0_9HYPH|nr:glutathione S-transferase family protein [Parvibaculum sedimenti]KAB7740086.1 glutathione S-transferase family protein [Parvibaculum sedimenti]